MTKTREWQTAFEAEISAGEKARLQGNEGKARVCARRAAGIVIAEYFKSTGVAVPSSGAYELLRLAFEAPDLPPHAGEICEHLLVRVSPDFSLPLNVDLLDEARKLKWILLEQTD